MTALDDRPRNGHSVPAPTPTKTLDTQPDSEGAPVAESARVSNLRDRLQRRTAERNLSHQLRDIDTDSVFEDVRSEGEQDADREVSEKIRAKSRKDRLRAGKSEVRRARRQRIRQRWDERAEATRDRILDPARSLGSDHRRWVASTTALFALIAGGVAWMSATVHDGLVGVAGNPLGYLVEPLASVLLIVSLLAQFTGRQREVPLPRAVLAFDIGLAVASLLLNSVPWGLRYGWDAGSLTAHILVPALVVAAVIAWHLASGIYGDALATSRGNSVTDEALTDRLGLLRQAVRSGELPVDVSATQVIKYLRSNLPGGIGHDAARRVARNFLGY